MLRALHHLTNKFTAATNNYIDFSRATNTIFSKNISTEEFLKRCVVMSITGTSMFFSAYYNDEEKTYCSSTTIAIASGVLTLTLAHVFLAADLFYKRYQLDEDCQNLVREIGKKVKDIPNISIYALDNAIESVLKLTMADEKRSNATLTWIKRKTLLNNLNNKLEISDPEFLSLLNECDTARTLNYLTHTNVDDRPSLKNRA